MNKNKKATSIIEAIIMILILLIGILGLFNIYTKSYNLSTSTKNKIEAIEIAREGIEAIENIRNTNWVLLGADAKNCWNVLNYNNNCVGNTTASSDSNNTDIKTGMYKIYTDSNGRWTLSKASGLTSKDYKNTSYRNFFRVNLDTNGLYTQNGGTNFSPIFTREINISYPQDTDSSGTADSNDEKMKINSIVMWLDSHGNSAHIVNLESLITNWRK